MWSAPRPLAPGPKGQLLLTDLVGVFLPQWMYTSTNSAPFSRAAAISSGPAGPSIR